MSRISYGDYYDELAPLRWGAWEHNSRRALAGKRGQIALRELEAALLALPEPKLAAKQFCVVRPRLGVPGLPIVEACALGALAWHRGLAARVPEKFNTEPLPPEVAIVPEDDADAIDQARWAAEELGLTYTLAWNVMEANDEMFVNLSPERRWKAMVGWIRENIQ